jgi:hypothetical protein
MMLTLVTSMRVLPDLVLMAIRSMIRETLRAKALRATRAIVEIVVSITESKKTNGNRLLT